MYAVENFLVHAYIHAYIPEDVFENVQSSSSFCDYKKMKTTHSNYDRID